MTIMRVLVPMMLAVILPGCATAGLAVAGAGAGVGMGAGVEHTLNGIVYKTFAASENEVRFAALKALDHLAMPVTADAKTAEGWQLSATAANRTIDIELQKLTNQTTRMRVVANDGGIFFKDASTASAIIAQTTSALDAEQAAAKPAGEHNRKRKPS